jgi:hypothetical protein
MDTLPFIAFGLGLIGAIFARQLPLSGTTAILLTAVPPAGLGLGAAFC